MPVKVRFELKGLEEYLEKLAQAGADIDGVCAEAVSAAGKVLVDGMLDRVPRGETGNLAASLQVSEPVKDGNAIVVEVGVRKDAPAEVHRYGLAQEYGWADHQGGKAGKSYIRPALEADWPKARAAMRKVFEGANIL